MEQRQLEAKEDISGVAVAGQLETIQGTREEREMENKRQNVSPITISNLLFFQNQKQPSLDVNRKYCKLSNQSPNAANIFRVKAGVGSERKERLTYVRYQNYTSARSRKTTEQKIFEVNSFVKKLTENLNQQEEIPEITETKFKALKKIIEYYDIKNLDHSEYSNVIKSFGLQIGSMRTELKTPKSFQSEKKSEIKRLRVMSLMNKTEKKIECRRVEQKSFFESQASKEKQVVPRAIMSEQKSKSRQTVQQPLNMFKSLQVRKQKLRGSSPRKFRFTNGQNCILDKVNKFRQFLFVLNYSNKLYRPLDIEAYSSPLRFYVGKGNNGNLIRSLMKKRFWFEETNSDKNAHFVWTQIKVNSVFNKQPCIEAVGGEVDSDFSRKSPLKLIANKNDPIGRVLVLEQLREVLAIQQLAKRRNVLNFEDRLRLGRRKIKKEVLSPEEVIHNHFPGNGMLGNKKGMFLCLKQYCRLTGLNVFDIVPKTFIISNGTADSEFNRMLECFHERKGLKKANFWILKPGEFSNRGHGIECTNKLEDIRKRVGKISKQKKKSLIIQEYITRPLLYNGRKFDLRTYMLLTFHNGKTKAYWYQDGYVRTSSAFFTLDETDPYIHLTNDAVQKYSDRYSRYEDGNKLSYPELQRYLDSLPSLGRNLNLNSVLIPRMKEIASLAVRSAWPALNKEGRDKNFEIFGLDFMIDEDFAPWLIEINTNPCLQLSSPVLERLIPHMVENALRISVDSLFPPPDNFGNNYKYNIPQNSLHYNKFEVIFDSDREGPELKALFQGGQFFTHLEGLQQDKNEYKQEGEMINFDDI